jgi:hypothetical protein
MKKVFSIIICGLCAASAYSQSLRVSFNGNRDFQVIVDNKTYNSGNYLDNDIVVNNLTGKHSVTVYRTNRNGRTKKLYSSAVNLSTGQEVHLTVNNDGSIDREETSANAGYGYRNPISETSFNQIYNSVNNKWGQPSKMSAARDIFNTSTYYFSTDQVRRIVELLNSEANRLELLKLSYDNVSDPDNYYRLQELLRSEASRNELDAYTRDNNYNNSNTNGNYKVAMTSAAFNQVYRDVSDQTSTSRKLAAATRAFNTTNNYFTVAQASELISLVTGDNNRLQLAKLALDNIIDTENISQLFNLLTSQSSKVDLDGYIRNNGFANGNYSYAVHAAMTETEFNNLYNTIRKKWLPLTKYSAAADAFNSSTNYFTTSQARQLISLLSSESNRLDLAKIAFDNVVDQQNFRQLYDLFTTQASKDALDEYLRSNYNYQ